MLNPERAISLIQQYREDWVNGKITRDHYLEMLWFIAEEYL